MHTRCIQFCDYLSHLTSPSENAIHTIKGSFLTHHFILVETKIATSVTIFSITILISRNYVLGFFFVPYRVANHNRRGKKKTCFKRKTSSDKILKWTRSALKSFRKTPGRHSAIYELSHPVGFTVKPTKGGFKFLYHRKVKVVYVTLRNHGKTSILHPDYFVRVITVYPVQ